MNIVGDCYISHRNVTDFYKIAILKNINQQFREWHKKYKEEEDENQRLFEEEQRKLQEIEDEKRAKEEEEERIKREEEVREREEREEREREEKEKEETKQGLLNKKTKEIQKEKTKKEDSKKKEKEDNSKNASNIKNSKNTSNLNASMSNSKDAKDIKGEKEKVGNILTDENKILEEEEPLDNYCSKSLMPIVKSKFDLCQEFVENYLLKNEEFWSKNRKKFYPIIPIDVVPPKIEENADELQD